MPCLIFEGPDGSGKTFTAEFISSAVNLPIHHSGGPPKSPAEMLIRTGKYLQSNNLIFDRFPIISDSIYGPILRDQYLFTEWWLTQIPFPVIYCRPCKTTMISSVKSNKNKPWKSDNHMRQVISKHIKIVDAYDRLMKQVPHIRFNRDKQLDMELVKTCAELISV